MEVITLWIRNYIFELLPNEKKLKNCEYCEYILNRRPLNDLQFCKKKSTATDSAPLP